MKLNEMDESIMLGKTTDQISLTEKARSMLSFQQQQQQEQNNFNYLTISNENSNQHRYDSFF